MYIEWKGDPDCLMHVDGIVIKAGDGHGLIQVRCGDRSATLYSGTETSARAVFNAMRRRLGAGGVIITDKWVKKVCAR